MQSNHRIAGLVLAVLFMTISVPPQASARIAYSAMSESESFHASSATKVFKHNVVAPWNGVRLKVALRVDHGNATLRLVDERGVTRWEKAFSAGKASVDETFAGTGTWRVELRLKDATGRYEIHLIAV